MRETVLLLLAVMTGSVMGLVVVWAGMSRRHWFLRTAVVGSFLSLWLLIPAYEIVLVLFTQSVVAILPLLVVRFFCERTSGCNVQVPSEHGTTPRARLQFSIRDLLLITVVVSMILAVAISAPKDVWVSCERFAHFFPIVLLGPLPDLPPAWVALVLSGIGAGLVTSLAAWVALGQRRLWLRLSAGLVTLFAAWVVLGQPVPWLRWVISCSIPVLLPLAGWLVLLRKSGWTRTMKHPKDSSGERPASGATRRAALTRVARVAAVLVSLLIVVPPGFVFFELAKPKPPIPRIRLPNPNGYDDLMKTRPVLEGVMLYEFDLPPLAVLRTLATKYRPVVETARRGLNRECRVPIRYSVDWSLESLSNNQAFRQLARVFVANGKVAEAEGSTADAIESYLDIVRLGRAEANGGLVLDRICRWPLEGIASHRLHEIREKLTSEQCRAIIDTLEATDDWEPWETVWARQRVWNENAFSWQGRLELMVSEWLETGTSWKQTAEEREKQVRAKRRLLICEMAVQGHRAEQGHFPARLGDLVPDYLSAVPEDPFSGKWPIYRRNSTGYLLYSIGPDGKDDGGQPLDFDTRLGDVVLETAPEDP